MSEKTRIILGGDDAALVIRADGSTELFIPGGDDDDLVPDTVLATMWLAGICNDENSIAEMALRFKEFAEENNVGSPLQ